MFSFLAESRILLMEHKYRPPLIIDFCFMLIQVRFAPQGQKRDLVRAPHGLELEIKQKIKIKEGEGLIMLQEHNTGEYRLPFNRSKATFPILTFRPSIHHKDISEFSQLLINEHLIYNSLCLTGLSFLTHHGKMVDILTHTAAICRQREN